MKINKLLADNFLRLNLLDLDLSGSVVHLVSGANESGKSSISEAIRFVLLDQMIRLGPKPKKSDRLMVIRDGAKTGSVAIEFDGMKLRRDIKTGDLEESAHYQPPTYLPYLLDAQKFATEPYDRRRAFLLGLTGTSVEPDDIAKRMTAKGVHEKCIEHIKPLLRSGFDAAHKEATTKASDSRSKWTGLTGKLRYGAQIAADWKPKTPKGYDPAALLAAEPELETLQGHINQQNIKKGGVVAALDIARKALAAQGEPVEKFDPAAFEALDIEISKARIAAATQDEAVLRLNTMISNAKNKVPVTCCNCHTQLTVSFESKAGGGSEAIVRKYKPVTAEAMRAMEADLLNASNESSAIKRNLEKYRADEAWMVALRDGVAADPGAVTAEDIEKLEASLQEINDDLAKKAMEQLNLNNRVLELRTAAARVRDAQQITERAQSIHRGVQEWTKCADALAPDGIPAEILSDTLKPVNSRLRETSIKTGWPQISIDPEMEILADGRRYSLLSESAKWRADVAIADAISYLSGLKLLVVDRVDVLDLDGRKQFFTWIKSIQGDYDTVIMFATLKQKPTLPGFTSHWLAGGEIQEDEECQDQ